MLRKLLTVLLGGSVKPKPLTVAPAPLPDFLPESGITVDKNDPRFQRIAREELAKCHFIRPEAIDAVFLYIRDQKKLFETKTPISVEEKRRLGINTRLKVTEELVAVLNSEGLQTHYPAEILPNLWRASTFRYRRLLEVEKLRRLKLCNQVTFSGVTGIDHCAWCNKVDGVKFSIDQDLDALLEANCKCEPYWMGFISPVFDDL